MEKEHNQKIFGMKKPGLPLIAEAPERMQYVSYVYRVSFKDIVNILKACQKM